MLVAGVSTLLAVPQSVPPVDVPEPFIEPRVLDGVARDDLALASAAEREPLDLDVRLLGSALRAYNLAEVGGDLGAVGAERDHVVEAARLAATHGAPALSRLRAYQLRSFLRELRRWEETGEQTDELRELGGPFLDRAEKIGWIEHGRLLPDATVRAVLFKKRWLDLTLTHGPGLDVTSVEARALARFLLLHPPHEAAAASAPESRAAVERAAFLADQYRLKKVEELRGLDPDYPADLGRGVVLYRLHRYPQAVEAFRRHLDAHPGGPYTIRAQNHLRAALGLAAESP